MSIQNVIRILLAFAILGSFSCNETEVATETRTQAITVSYSRTLGEVRSGLFAITKAMLDIDTCDMSGWTVIDRVAARTLLDDAYDDYTSKGSHYSLASDIIFLDSDVVALHAVVGGNSLLHFPYPDDLASYVTIPTEIDCNLGLTINLTEVASGSGTCVPCSECEGNRGPYCTCTCWTGCGGPCSTTSCPTSNCQYNNGLADIPIGVCNTTKPWTEGNLFSGLSVDDTL